jgi:hypothetical protein
MENTKEKPEKISWKTYLINISLKIVVFLVMVALLVLTVILSNPSQLELTNIKLEEVALLIIVSSVLYLLVLGSFSYLLFSSEKENFNIENIYSKKAAFLGFLVLIFISLLYLLLDVALADEYLELGPVMFVGFLEELLVQCLNVDLGLFLPNTIVTTNYYSLRNNFFIAFYIALLFFPLAIILLILTREGRHTLLGKDKETTKEESTTVRSLLIVIFILPSTIISLMLLLQSEIIDGIIFFTIILLIGLLLYCLWNLAKLLFLGTKLLAFFTYSNFLIIFPIITLFYLFPIGMWGIWDIIEVFRDNPGTPIDIANIVMMWIGFLGNNFLAVNRILQFDFMLIIAIAAIVIGFAEGYSIGALIGSFKRGSSIIKTGEAISKSPPRVIAITNALVPITAWAILLVDKFGWIVRMIELEFHIQLPQIEFPRVLIFLTSIIEWIKEIVPVLAGFAILIIPLYIIITSALKFFSVKLVTKWLKDQQLFMLLISSAFVLIVTTILADIQELALKTNSPKPVNVPLLSGFFYTQGILPWTIKIVMYLESFAFYAGFVYMIIVVGKFVKAKLEKRSKKEEESLGTKITDKIEIQKTEEKEVDDKEDYDPGYYTQEKNKETK